MFEELKFKFMKGLPRVYAFLFHCMNDKTFKIELKAMSSAIENEMLKDDLIRSLNQIKQLYSSGKLVLNKNSIERV